MTHGRARPRLLVALAVTAALGAAPADAPLGAAPAGTYTLDPAGASLTAKIRPIQGLPPATLRFRRLEGGFDYDPAAWRATRLRLTVDPRSAADGSAVSREAVKRFEPEKYPTISFVSGEMAGAAGQGEIRGDLSMHGRTRPIVLKVVVRAVEPPAPGAPWRIAFSGAGQVRRSDFGIDAGPLAGDRVDLKFDVEFVWRDRQQSIPLIPAQAGIQADSPRPARRPGLGPRRRGDERLR